MATYGYARVSTCQDTDRPEASDGGDGGRRRHAVDRTQRTSQAAQRLAPADIDDLEPKLMRHGDDVRILASQLNAKPAEIRQFLRGCA